VGDTEEVLVESLYLWLKFVHVAAVTVWVGGVFALMVINARLARVGEPATVAALGQQSEAFGRTVIGPAMGVVLIAGLWMAGQFGIPFTSLWIVWGLAGFVLFILLGVVALGRTGAELGALARTAGPNDSRVAALRQRIAVLGWLNVLVLASVIWAMVFKPTL
jgi:putative membrane protein